MADAAAFVLPFVPGGVGTARKALKATRIAAEAIGGAEAIISGADNVKEGLENGNYLQAGLGTVQAVAGVGQIGSAVNKTSKLVQSTTLKVTDGGKKSVDIDLKYKEGWTTKQKAEADSKVKALSEARTVKTPVNREKTSAASRYKSAYGKSSIPNKYDVDHTIDLQLGGADDILNMNPIDMSVNRSLGTQIQKAIAPYPDGTVFENFTIQ